MKKLKIWSMIMLVVMAQSLMVACGDDGDDNNQPKPPTYKIHDNNIVGVWKNGNYFVSFSSDNFNSSILSTSYLDEGDYSVNGDTIIVRNSYFNHQTRYVVKSISEFSLNIEISYIDYLGKENIVNKNFTKTTDIPCSKSHNLIGKTYNASYAGYKGLQHWNKVFSTYNIITCTCTDAGSYTPFTCYYIYLPPKIYFYVKGYSEFEFDRIKYADIILDSNNQIESMGDLHGSIFY